MVCPLAPLAPPGAPGAPERGCRRNEQQDHVNQTKSWWVSQHRKLQNCYLLLLWWSRPEPTVEPDGPENWWGTLDMQHAIDAQASDFMMPDVMKIGGVTGWLRAAALAQTRGIPID